MSRALVTLWSAADRARAADWIAKAPPGTRVEFKAARRSVDQNSRFWAMLTDFATQLPWDGERRSTTEWKYLFLDALNREAKMVPNLDGTGFVNIGRSSSDLSKTEMSELFALMEEFGARHGVVFSDPTEAAA